MAVTITPQLWNYYKARIKYHRTDDLKPDALENGSEVHLSAMWVADEGEKFAGDVVFSVAESSLWLPERDLELIEDSSYEEFMKHRR